MLDKSISGAQEKLTNDRLIQNQHLGTSNLAVNEARLGLDRLELTLILGIEGIKAENSCSLNPSWGRLAKGYRKRLPVTNVSGCLALLAITISIVSMLGNPNLKLFDDHCPVCPVEQSQVCFGRGRGRARTGGSSYKLPAVYRRLDGSTYSSSDETSAVSCFR